MRLETTEQGNLRWLLDPETLMYSPDRHTARLRARVQGQDTGRVIEGKACMFGITAPHASNYDPVGTS